MHCSLSCLLSQLHSLLDNDAFACDEVTVCCHGEALELVLLPPRDLKEDFDSYDAPAMNRAMSARSAIASLIASPVLGSPVIAIMRMLPPYIPS